MTARQLSPGHEQALAELERISEASKNSVASGSSAEGGSSEPAERTLTIDGASVKLVTDNELHVDVLLDCAGVTTENNGAELDPVERVTIAIDAEFPFEQPIAITFNPKLASLQHVIWGHYICLYDAEDDWDSSDGMMGFISRLATWFLRAANGTLDAPGEPIDPPISNSARASGFIVVDPDLPRECAATWTSGQPWFGVASVHRADDDRMDVLGWESISQSGREATRQLNECLSGMERKFSGQLLLAPVVVLPGPMTFTFPETLGQLASALVDQGMEIADFSEHLGRVAQVNSTRTDEPAALYVFVGSPMRGTACTKERQIHLAAWELAGRASPGAVRLLRLWEITDPAHPGLTRDDARIHAIIDGLPIWWATVYERRPEVVQRRDGCRPVEWLRENGGRVVLILGCGALGAPIAEHCLRGGARKLVLVDSKPVTPGVLVRQPYDDGDIGQFKAETLARKLEYVGSRTEIRPLVEDALQVIRDGSAVREADLIIDATANQTVAEMIELERWTATAEWPPVLTVSIGHLAERGFAALTLPSATGAGADLIRKLALAAHEEKALAGIAEDFFPRQRRTDIFIPEPGCFERHVPRVGGRGTGPGGQSLRGSSERPEPGG